MSSALLRTRAILPAVLVVLVLLYELLWKGRLVAPGSWSERGIDLALFLLVAPAMAIWGLSSARGFLQRLASSEAASEEKSRVLEQRNRQLQTVLQASRAITSVLDLEQVAGLVVEQVAAYTRFTKAALVLADAKGTEMRMVGSHGLSQEHIARFIAAIQGPGRASSPLEWCRITRQPVVVQDLARDFRTTGLAEVFALAGVESMIAVPLVAQDRFRGGLIVYLEKTAPISTAEISLVTALGGQAALALDNASLYTETDRHRTRLDKAVGFLESVASALARTRVGVSPLLLMVVQSSAELFQPACVRLEVAKSGRRASQTLVEASGMDVADVAGMAPALSLPVTLDGETFGVFEIFLGGEGRELDQEDRRILKAFVHLTASALGNATVVAEMRLAVNEVERAYMGTLEALIKALEIRDHETEGHSRRVVQYTLALAQQLGVSEDQLVPIMRGALLHDIGKIGVPDAILRKPGPLSAEEWTIMKQHTRFGYQMLKGIDFLKEATPIILSHHERFDGTGYPTGLSEVDIPLGARIFAVADAYDAITSDRPYRRGRTHEAALEEIRSCAGTQFDPTVVAALLSLPDDEMIRMRGRRLELVK